jgi:hypothetical protein
MENFIYFTIILISLIFIFIIVNLSQNKNKEGFSFMPWNIGTRFYPTWDIRGDPNVYPWNYQFNSNVVYTTPYFYRADGKFVNDKEYVNLVNQLIQYEYNRRLN